MAEKKIIVEREDLSSLSSHIREKSGSEAASLTWPTGFINEVDNISTGVDISGVTASAADILYDKKTFDINGDLVTGTIQQQTATNRNITAASQVETINAGYYPSSFTVGIPSSAVTGLSAGNMLSTATVLGVTGDIPTVSPSKEELTTAADYVTIPLGYHPTVKTITIASSAITDLNSNNILSGKTILGVEGSIPTQSISNSIISTVSQSIPIPSGYYAFDTAISIKSEDQENLVPSNIKSGVTILGVTGTIEGGTVIEDTRYKSIVERTITSMDDSTITTIGSNAFYSFLGLSQVSFDVCTSIGFQAFAYCPTLRNATFGSCENIGSMAFLNCSTLSFISFPQCTQIQYSAFSGCSVLANADFPNCSAIEHNAFYNCFKLSTANFPSAKFVGSYAFANCSALSTVNLPLCESVFEYAFQSCNSLTHLELPSCSFVSASAFNQCKTLATVSLPACSSVNMYAFNSCISLTDIFAPNLISISNYAFSSCSKLTAVSLPRLSTLGANAFQGCSSLATVDLPEVTTVSGSAFYGCSRLQSAHFPLCGAVFAGAFISCFSLSAVTIAGRSSHSCIYSSAFWKCYHLLNLTITGSSVAKLAATNAFLSTPISTYTTSTGGVNGSIYVPASLVDAYKSATNWAIYASRITSIPEPTP